MFQRSVFGVDITEGDFNQKNEFSYMQYPDSRDLQPDIFLRRNSTCNTQKNTWTKENN